jgi:beta-N-acetylhexosaminidase
VTALRSRLALGRWALGGVAALAVAGALAGCGHSGGTASSNSTTGKATSISTSASGSVTSTSPSGSVTSTSPSGSVTSTSPSGSATSTSPSGTSTTPPGTSGGVAPSTPAASAVKLLGQRIMVGLTGTTASSALLREVREGSVGSVILFSANIVSQPQTLGLTGALQQAARAGGNPPLLIAVDQEGGEVKRLPSGPPDLSPPEIADTGSTAMAASEGRATGRYLRQWGINMDLAPVVDVPTFRGAFIERQSRAFSFDAASVAKYATAFALGLQGEHVAATAKHFPGLGSARADTDDGREVLRPTAAQLSAALLPYRAMIPRGLDAVLVSTPGFPAYDPSGASAALSRLVIQGLLRGQLKFGGVTITDALGTPTGHDEITAGVLAAAAGADILLYTDAGGGVLAALEAALHRGTVTGPQAAASYARIVALKHRLADR